MPYIGNQPGTGVRSRFIYTATASQTTFSGADDNSKTLKYADSAYVDVFLNGVCLVPGTDYTASTKTSIVLTQAASVSDTLEVIAYDIASMSDMSASNGGTFQADVTFAAGADLITASAGTDNVRLGEDAGASIASGGNYNVAIGKDAGTAITTGDGNVAVGFEALKTEDANGHNTAVGYQALKTLNAGGNSQNTAVGYQAGTSITTGVENTLVGYGAGDAITDADYNVGVGWGALGANVLGSKSVAVGTGALDAQNPAGATDMHNTAVGHGAGGSVTTGTGNTYIGSSVGDANTDGVANVAMGGDGTYAALAADTRGKFTTAIGFGALYAQNFTSSTATNNTALGYFAGGLNSTGTDNTYIGHGAGDDCTDGVSNTVVGAAALSADADDRNTAVGAASLQVNTGEQNTAVGASSLAGCTSGINNTAMGYAAIGLATTTGNYNTAFGFAAGGNITSGGNNIAIGNGAARAGAPGGLLQTGSNEIALGNDSITSFSCKVSLTATSDERDKTDFENLDLGLDFVKELKPVTYVWDDRIQYVDKTKEDWEETLDLDTVKSDGSKKSDDLQVGFKAQDVIALEDAAGYKLSDKTNLLATVTDDGKQYGLMYERFIPILTKAIQELSAKNDALEAQNTTQATQIADLITRVTALEAG